MIDTIIRLSVNIGINHRSKIKTLSQKGAPRSRAAGYSKTIYPDCHYLQTAGEFDRPIQSNFKLLIYVQLFLIFLADNMPVENAACRL